jgi:hypothetical protein
MYFTQRRRVAKIGRIMFFTQSHRGCKRRGVEFGCGILYLAKAPRVQAQRRGVWTGYVFHAEAPRVQSLDGICNSRRDAKAQRHRGARAEVGRVIYFSRKDFTQRRRVAKFGRVMSFTQSHRGCKRRGAEVGRWGFRAEEPEGTRRGIGMQTQKSIG